MKLTRLITFKDKSNEPIFYEVKFKKNELGRAKHNRRAKLQHINENKPLEFLAIAKRETFKAMRSEEQRNERKAKRKK